MQVTSEARHLTFTIGDSPGKKKKGARGSSHVSSVFCLVLQCVSVLLLHGETIVGVHRAIIELMTHDYD